MHCSVCNNAHEKPTKICGGCNAEYYCSASCQRADWSVHRQVCKHGSSSSQQQRIASNNTMDTPAKIGLLDVNPSLAQVFSLHNVYTGPQNTGMDENAQQITAQLSAYTRRYDALRYLGAGVFGVVFSANVRNVDPSFAVAVKLQVMSPQASVNNTLGERAVQRFLTRLFVNAGNDVVTYAPIVKQYDYALFNVTMSAFLASVSTTQQRVDAIRDAVIAHRRRISPGAAAAAAGVVPTRTAHNHAQVEQWYDTQLSSVYRPHQTVAFSVMEQTDTTLASWLINAHRYRAAYTGVVMMAQVLCTLHMLSSCVDFTHFDLHAQNVLLLSDARAAATATVLRYTLSVDATMFIDTDWCDRMVAKLGDFGHTLVRHDAPDAGLKFTRSFPPYHGANAPRPRSAVTNTNPAFDLQRLACSCLNTIIRAERDHVLNVTTGAALATVDVELLDVWFNMLQFINYEAPLSHKRYNNHIRTVYAARRTSMSELVDAVRNALRYRRRTRYTLAELKARMAPLEHQIVTLIETVGAYPFIYHRGTSLTAKDVLLNTPALSAMLSFDTATLHGRRVVDLSLNVGNSGSGSLPPFFERDAQTETSDDDSASAASPTSPPQSDSSNAAEDDDDDDDDDSENDNDDNADDEDDAAAAADDERPQSYTIDHFANKKHTNGTYHDPQDSSYMAS